MPQGFSVKVGWLLQGVSLVMERLVDPFGDRLDLNQGLEYDLGVADVVKRVVLALRSASLQSGSRTSSFLRAYRMTSEGGIT